MRLVKGTPSFSCWRPKYSEEVTAASGSVTACPARPSLPLCPPRQPLRTAITGEQCEAQPPPFPSTAGRCSCSFLLGRAHQNKMRRRMNDDDTAQAYTNTVAILTNAFDNVNKYIDHRPMKLFHGSTLRHRPRIGKQVQ